MENNTLEVISNLPSVTAYRYRDSNLCIVKDTYKCHIEGQYLLIRDIQFTSYSYTGSVIMRGTWQQCNIRAARMYDALNSRNHVR